MWIWDGVITPEPGESIQDSAQEAVNIARKYGGGRESTNCYFKFDFNDITLRAYPRSNPKEIVEEYFKQLQEKWANR